MTRDPRSEKALRLLDAAQQIAAPNTFLGQRARALLHAETGLSPQGIDLALDYCLEHWAGRSGVLQLQKRLLSCETSHVLLAGNVFVAAFRAILLGVLQADTCFVRPSSRAQTMAQLLHEGSGAAFELTTALKPKPGDHVWAYASDATLASLRAELPRGVFLYPHGHGMSVAVFVEPKQRASDESLWEAVSGLTTDVILFDQRGCLSPRLVLIQGSLAFSEKIARFLEQALSDAQTQIPRGTLSADEEADARHYEAIFRYLGAFRRAGRGGVTLDPLPERRVVPPSGRYLHLVRTNEVLNQIEDLKPHMTALAVFGDDLLEGTVRSRIGPCRIARFGELQKPPLDGPVDLRPGPTPERLS
jgi:hypothetical protein